MNKQKGFTSFELSLGLFWLVLVVGGLIGWILNIVDIANSDFENVTGMLVLRIIGVFVAPLGAILGWF